MASSQTMKTLALALTLATTISAADIVFDAMQAELQRSMTLQLQQLDKPYFVSYAIDDGITWSAVAAQGALIGSNTSRFRRPAVQIRVGDYNFDNSSGGRGGGRGASYNLPGFPLDDDAAVIRHYLWLETDSAYKAAVQAIAQKRSAQRGINVNAADLLPDFAPAKPFVMMKDRAALQFDGKIWNERVKRVSAIFNSYPALRDASVDYSVFDGVHRYVNTEGTRIHEPQSEGNVRLRASIQAADGMLLRDSAIFYTLDVAKLASEDELTKTARGLADQLSKMAAAPIGDAYSGPVLFEGIASAQLMAEILGRNLHITRRTAGGRGGPPGGRGGRGGPVSAGTGTELEGRRGVRIMPEMFSVLDDPALPLFGHTEVDNEGVPSKPVSLVEKGVLKDFLHTRLPVPSYTESNGRALLGSSPAPTNLIISTSEKTSLPDIRKRMIDLCKQRSLPYGIIVRKFEFPGNGVPAPLYVYRLYLDGHEEMIRAVRLRGVNARSLKDILLAGDDKATLDYVENGGGSADVTVIAPSVLIDDLEIVRLDDNLPKLPIAPPPAK